MSRRGGVALLDGRYGGFHKAFEQCLNIVVELAVFVSYGRLRSERQRQAHRAFVERLHVRRNVHLAAQTRRRIVFRVDQLQHAENFALGVAHRQCEQRFRAVARLAVVVIVEVKRHFRRM